MRTFFATSLALMLGFAVPASAAMDCNASLEKYSMMVAKSSHSASKRAQAQRMALDGYHACMSGNEFEAKTFFERLASMMR